MAEDKMEIENVPAESTKELQKNRIRFLQSVLNIYRARVLSLNSACKSRVANITIPEHTRNFESLREQIRGLQNDVTLLKTYQECVNSIHNNITFVNMSNLKDAEFVRGLQQVIKEISFFSLAIMKLYEENLNEIERIQKKQNYSTALLNHKNDLSVLNERQKHVSRSEDELRVMQKLEDQVTKINVIRNMKLILIGKYAGLSEGFAVLEQFRTPFRRNLTIDDFSETWDVGVKYPV